MVPHWGGICRCPDGMGGWADRGGKSPTLSVPCSIYHLPDYGKEDSPLVNTLSKREESLEVYLMSCSEVIRKKEWFPLCQREGYSILLVSQIGEILTVLIISFLMHSSQGCCEDSISEAPWSIYYSARLIASSLPVFPPQINWLKGKIFPIGYNIF